MQRMTKQHRLVQHEYVTKSSNPEFSLKDIVGYDDIKREVGNLSPYDVDVLILGETGVGKELFASAIHNLSARKHKAFVYLDCSTVPLSLLETELFGYKKGSFTDAKEDRVGKIEYADGGTLFLDEIGNIPLESQAKILRVIENKDLCRVGDNRRRLIDVRFIFATNENLVNAINEKRFRKDLYYRINFHSITVPPLRKRKREIPKISKYYWEKWNQESNLDLALPNEEEMRILSDNNYPGNIRELIGLLQRIYIKSEAMNSQKRADLFRKEIYASKGKENFKSLEEKIKEYVREVVGKTKNLSEAARILDIDRKTLRKKLKC